MSFAGASILWNGRGLDRVEGGPDGVGEVDWKGSERVEGDACARFSGWNFAGECGLSTVTSGGDC